MNLGHLLRIACKPRLVSPASNPLFVTSPLSTWMEIRRFSQANGGTLIGWNTEIDMTIEPLFIVTSQKMLEHF